MVFALYRCLAPSARTSALESLEHECMEEYQFHVSIELNATVTPPQSNLRVLLQVQL